MFQTINQATVVAVGPGRVLKDGSKLHPSCQPGDTVVVPEFGGMSIKFDEAEYHVFRDEDVVGIIKVYFLI